MSCDALSDKPVCALEWFLRHDKSQVWQCLYKKMTSPKGRTINPCSQHHKLWLLWYCVHVLLDLLSLSLCFLRTFERCCTISNYTDIILGSAWRNNLEVFSYLCHFSKIYPKLNEHCETATLTMNCLVNPLFSILFIFLILHLHKYSKKLFPNGSSKYKTNIERDSEECKF